MAAKRILPSTLVVAVSMVLAAPRLANAVPFPMDRDPCLVRTDGVPCLHVPPCGSVGGGLVSGFKISTAAGDVPATQQTNGSICWSPRGLHVHEIATDGSIFSPYTKCNSQVFSKSDVLEVFLAPVENPTENPMYYYELDTSPSGAFFGKLMENNAGNSSTCISSFGCKNPGILPCSGRASFAYGMTSTASNSSAGDAWSIELFVPWEIFPAKYAPNVREKLPWSTWRMNFYRYSYPSGPDKDYDNYELNAWSPTHSSSFHVPARFGVVVLDPH